MTLTLHLTPEIEAMLKDKANYAGRSPEELALEVLQDGLAMEAQPNAILPPGSRLAELRAWQATRPRGNPNADFSRESIYDDRGT